MIDRSCHGHLFIVGETSAECQRQIHDQSRTSKWVYDCISKQTSREQDPAEQTRSRTLGLTREPRPGGPVLFEVAGKTQLADRDPAIEPACPFASTAASPNGSGDDGSGDALRSRPLRRAPAPPYRRRNYPLAAGSQRAQPISIVTHAPTRVRSNATTAGTAAAARVITPRHRGGCFLHLSRACDAALRTGGTNDRTLRDG
jgi:hypothetical protein